MRLRSSGPFDSRSSRRWPGLRAASAALALSLGATLSACPSAPARRPEEPKRDPIVFPDLQLCQGSDGDPAGEGDPRCATDASHEQVILVHHAAGCSAGLRGPVDFSLEHPGGDAPKRQLLATLAPGERKAFQLPRGESELIIAGEESRPLALGGSGPVTVAVGCGPEAFRGQGLQPLVLLGAALGCVGGKDEPREGAPIKVRAGGLDLVVGPREAQTILLPRGAHVVKVAGELRSIEIGEGGLTVPLGTCTSPRTP